MSSSLTTSSRGDETVLQDYAGGNLFFCFVLFCLGAFCWMIAVGVDGSVDGACGVGVGVGGVGVCF